MRFSEHCAGSITASLDTRPNAVYLPGGVKAVLHVAALKQCSLLLFRIECRKCQIKKWAMSITSSHSQRWRLKCPHRCFHSFWFIRPLLRLKLSGANLFYYAHLFFSSCDLSKCPQLGVRSPALIFKSEGDVNQAQAVHTHTQSWEEVQLDPIRWTMRV